MKLFNFLNNIKLMEFPELRQSYSYDCGASALQGVFFYYGFEPREVDLVKELNVDPEIGAEPADIVRVCKKYGLRAETRENMTIDDLKKNVDAGVPTLLIVQAWPDKPVDWEMEYDWGHYVVAIGYDDKRVYFEDPASTVRTWLTYDELNKRWHAYEDQEKKSDHFGIEIYGKPSGFHHQKVEHMD